MNKDTNCSVVCCDRKSDIMQLTIVTVTVLKKMRLMHTVEYHIPSGDRRLYEYINIG